MKPVMTLEMLGPQGWVDVGSLEWGMMPGSISNKASGTREVIRFGWVEGDIVIDRSIAGADMEEGSLRRIVSEGFQKLATLKAGESFEMPVQTDGMTEILTLRFTHKSRGA